MPWGSRRFSDIVGVVGNGWEDTGEGLGVSDMQVEDIDPIEHRGVDGADCVDDSNSAQFQGGGCGG
jgi:hypothetical protein